MNTLIHTGLLMLLLSSSPALCQWLPPPFLCSFIKLSSQPTLPSPWNCNRSGWSSHGGLGAVTRLCVTRAGCYISGSSAPLTQACLYLHTPTCAPTHTAFLLRSSEPLMRLSGHVCISEGTKLMLLQGLAMSHQVYLEVSYGGKRILRVRRRL